MLPVVKRENRKCESSKGCSNFSKQKFSKSLIPLAINCNHKLRFSVFSGDFVETCYYLEIMKTEEVLANQKVFYNLQEKVFEAVEIIRF